MLQTLKLLLPALLPSWAFFKAVEPSPRVQWRLLQDVKAASPDWQEFRPRPDRLPPLTFLARLFWNPRWNESLYLVSLSERLMLAPTQHSIDEIQRCLAEELARQSNSPTKDKHLQFRLIFVERENGGIGEVETFRSSPIPMAEITP